MQVERLGLGYQVRFEQGVEIDVERIRRSRDELSAEVTVIAALPGIVSRDGHVHAARLNLSSTSARGTLARHLAGRAPGVDWAEILERTCLAVLTGERAGEPIETVGNRPQRIRPRFLVDPILPADKPTILFGEGGTGKSTLAAAIAVSVETGIDVIAGWRPSRPTNVLYLDWETGPDDIDERVRGVAAGAGITDEVAIAYRFCSGPIADMVDELAREIARQGIGLVIVDSLGLAGGISSDGDAADGALRMFAGFRALRCTVLGIDHVSKSSADDPNRPGRPYGSVYKTNLARATFELRQGQTIGDRTHLGLYNTKSNVGRPLRPIGLSIEYASDGSISYRTEELAGELTKPLSLPAKITALLAEGAMTTADIAAETEEPENKIRATLSRGRKEGRYVGLPDGRWGVSYAG